MEYLRPYPALEGSDELRIGDIPKHWDTVPLSAIAKPKTINNQYGRELLSVYLNLGVVPFASVKEKRTNVTSEDLSNYQAVDPGDFVLNNQQAWRGSVGVSMHKGIVSPAYLVLSLGSRIHPRYANLLLRERSMVAQYLIASKGVGSIQRNLYWPHLKRISIILPPLSEQSSIVRFLDHVDRKIRRYIRAKQKLIRLLEEQKQAIIHHAITRGLDPSVRLNPSGVEWLGNVPEHWEVRRCRYIFREVDKRSSDGAEQHLSMSQRLGLVPSDLVENRTLVSESYAGGKLCEVGDLVLNRLKAHLGVFALARYAGVISPDYTVLRPIEKCVVEYFEGVLRSPACRRELRIRAKGIVEGFWRLYTDDFYDIRLPVPPAEECKEIVEYFMTETDAVARAVLQAEREIDLLREYRTRLIADVVTGKLDVRKAAAQLPAEDQELPPIDELVDILDTEEDAPDDFDEAPQDPEP